MKNTEIFKKEVYEKYGLEYSVLGNYNGGKTKIEMKHTGGCGKIFFASPSNILQGHLCPYCRKSEKKTDKQFKQEVFNSVKNEYTFLEEYKTVKTKLKVRHNICGFEYFIRPDKFLEGQRCPKCKGVLKYNTASFKEKIKSISEEYILLSEYKNNKTPVQLKHLFCGNSF